MEGALRRNELRPAARQAFTLGIFGERGWLSHAGRPGAVLALDALHLIFQAQFELLQPDLFQLFIVGKIPFLDQGIETFGVA